MRRIAACAALIIGIQAFGQEDPKNTIAINFGGTIILNQMEEQGAMLEIEYDHAMTDTVSFFVAPTFAYISEDHVYGGLEIGLLWLPFRNWLYVKLYPELVGFYDDYEDEEPEYFILGGVGAKIGFQYSGKHLMVRAGFCAAFPFFTYFEMLDLGIGYRF